MAKEAGTRLFLGVPLAAGFLDLLALFAVGRFLSFWTRMGLASLSLLMLATALFMALWMTLRLPSKKPRLRAGAAVILILGGAAILMMTPFAALALAAFAGG